MKRLWSKMNQRGIFGRLPRKTSKRFNAFCFDYIATRAILQIQHSWRSSISIRPMPSFLKQVEKIPTRFVFSQRSLCKWRKLDSIKPPISITEFKLILCGWSDPQHEWYNGSIGCCTPVDRWIISQLPNRFGTRMGLPFWSRGDLLNW